MPAYEEGDPSSRICLVGEIKRHKYSRLTKIQREAIRHDKRPIKEVAATYGIAANMVSTIRHKAAFKYKPSQLDWVIQNIVHDPGSGCWHWCGKTAKNGYGRITHDGGKRSEAVHRVTYRGFRGEIPKGLDLDHLCRNRGCCNPFHLEPITRAENNRRGLTGKTTIPLTAQKYLARSHCKHGHLYTEENTIHEPKFHGSARICKTCRQNRSRARYEKWKATQ